VICLFAVGLRISNVIEALVFVVPALPPGAIFDGS
jgi:hypothetical protein